MALERRSPLQRRAPLNPGTSSLRRAPLQRGSGLSRGPSRARVELVDEEEPEPTPVPAAPLARPPRYERDAPRRPDALAKPERGGCGEAKARQIVYARSGRVCEGCGRARATDWAHRVAEGQGGPWCPSNGLNLCSSCHTGWAHLNPKAARARGWILESHEDPTVVPVEHAWFGRVLLRPDGAVQACPPSKY